MPVVDGEKPRSGATSPGARWQAPNTADGIGAVYDRAEFRPPPERGAQCSSCLLYPAHRPPKSPGWYYDMLTYLPTVWLARLIFVVVSLLVARLILKRLPGA